MLWMHLREACYHWKILKKIYMDGYLGVIGWTNKNCDVSLKTIYGNCRREDDRSKNKVSGRP
ncbi:hypothetical protein TUM4445_30360 [Shewanella sp. MBTL60-112-B2]|nr:hypothetical protein TUM4444_25190 [Shewanella sp. MBTL60-112-B1]GIU37624.1 hypothetical protein TUM4445_30360 [Shewanella sp. MBTL60-112-B2]